MSYSIMLLIAPPVPSGFPLLPYPTKTLVALKVIESGLLTPVGLVANVVNVYGGVAVGASMVWPTAGRAIVATISAMPAHIARAYVLASLCGNPTVSFLLEIWVVVFWHDCQGAKTMSIREPVARWRNYDEMNS